jgi:tetratricopeptide (TPR) repeat protein
VSKKKPPGRAQPADLKTRARRAANEGRHQSALELARQLHKEQPTSENLQFLRTCYLNRARQQRETGHTRDAAETLQAGLTVTGSEGPWVADVMNELFACGEPAKALALLETLPDDARPRALGKAADAALQVGADGRKQLPPELHPDFDRVVQAFADAEAGKDDSAREAMAAIGLRSPFLEWKVLLRGLQAFYAGDDVRALENWQRLAPDRLPARVAAPLRFRIDKDYRTAQPPETQLTLQRQADRLQASSAVTQLRDLQKALSSDESLRRPFQLAETLVPRLKEEAPHLIPRLATCFYWSVITAGGPEDVPRFQRVFGTPPDDPGFHRLRALAMENARELHRAHEEWKKFEASIATNTKAWHGAEGQRARALVLQHMGRNAEMAAELDEMPMPFAFMREPKLKKLSPSPEECFRRAAELAPDDLGVNQSLLRYYREHEQTGKGIKAAEAVLKHHPGHVETLQTLGKLYMEDEKPDKALEAFKQALKGNPLNRELRGNVCTAHLFLARALAEAGKFEAARAEYQASLALEVGDKSSALCKWAACEFKAGETEKAEELLQKALAEAKNNRLAIAFSMLIEVIRLKLPRTLKTRFDKEFKEALAEPPTAEGAVAVASTAAVHRLVHIQYTGQKTHEAKALAYLKGAQKVEYTESQLERLCPDLVTLGSPRLTQAYLDLARQKFPNNPYFPYLEAETHFRKGEQRMSPWRVQPLLQTARRLAEAMPRDDRVKRLLEQIREREQDLNALNPFLSILGGGGPFDPFGDGFDDEEYDDEF